VADLPSMDLVYQILAMRNKITFSFICTEDLFNNCPYSQYIQENTISEEYY
jgi:hypothetical protein